jgi:quercetin dioxygenase-like cupin family protein
MFVLEGRLSINVDGIVYTLDTHDSIAYHGNLLREFACSGEADVAVICTVIPPVL